MAVTRQDLELFAARIRPYFEPELRDIAYELALAIARTAGAKAKQLRPETTVRELLSWCGIDDPIPARDSLSSHAIDDPIPARDSLDEVELVMALEEGFGLEISDVFAGQPPTATFRDVVLHHANRRRAA